VNFCATYDCYSIQLTTDILSAVVIAIPEIPGFLSFPKFRKFPEILENVNSINSMTRIYGGLHEVAAAFKQSLLVGHLVN